MKTISNLNVKGKTILLRSDLNCDIINGKVVESERIKESTKTIIELKKKKAKVIVLAHQGHPGKKDFISLKQHAKLLNKYVRIKFVKDIIGKKTISEIEAMNSGEVLLLENIRFEKSEFKHVSKKNKLIKTLLPLADIYINDSFSVSHRNHISLVGFAKYLPSYAGRLMEKEVKALKSIRLRNCLYILGGAKSEDNIKLLNNKKKVLACGLFGQLCVIAKDRNLGAQNKFLKNKLYLVRKLKKKLKNVKTPQDFAVKVRGKRKELLLKEFPSKHEIFDIGKNTIKNYIDEIKKAKVIFMKGPAGDCSDKFFCKGTEAILKAIVKNKGFSLIGGGQLNDAIKKLKISKSKFGYVSLSGGALMKYISGEKLVGLEVLD